MKMNDISSHKFSWIVKRNTAAFLCVSKRLRIEEKLILNEREPLWNGRWIHGANACVCRYVLYVLYVSYVHLQSQWYDGSILI